MENVSVRELLLEKGSTVYSIRPESTVFEALSLMAERNIGALLVMKGDSLEGIITERDYARKVALQGRHSENTTVGEIMSPIMYQISSSGTLSDAMSLMSDHHVRHLPVIDDSRVVGILSIIDLVKRIITVQRMEINHLQNYITGRYMA
jgi:CBS domain-containing protein